MKTVGELSMEFPHIHSELKIREQAYWLYITSSPTSPDATTYKICRNYGPDADRTPTQAEMLCVEKALDLMAEFGL